ncbi:MAG TPA: cytochrome c biogenesis protein CcdA [Candidatus Acidoferrales bacterium]|jgi:cytochrome c-type biogenesis protein|nr:cytochrome c biogenesis protein CcdA [Candidatus Acidoferrales bacterium]
MSVAVLAGLFVFAAGLGSFLSPCVLPLVPGYLSMLSGVGVEQLREDESGASKLLPPALAFVIGLSSVFITMGATASVVGHFLLQHRNLLAPVAGALIVLFGLHLIGVLTKITVRVGLIVGSVLVAIGLFLNFGTHADMAIKPVHLYATSLIFLFGPALTRWLNRDVHLRDVGGKSPGIVSGFLLGFAFALGWTPCIGPILTTVLAIAAARGSVRDGIILLTLYSAGLSIPFLLTAVGVGRFMRFYKKFRRHLHTVEVCSGVLLLFIGALIFTNGLTMVSSHLNGGSLDVLLEKVMPASVKQYLNRDNNSVSADANLPPAPSVTFKNLQGADVSLDSFKGKVVLLNFWATWCEPCRGEIPVLIGLQDKYGSRGFTMLGASMDDDGAKAVDPFIRDNRFNVGGKEEPMDYPIVLGSDPITDKFGGLLGMPTSYLISRDGKIVKKYIGVVNEAQITKDVESQL